MLVISGFNAPMGTAALTDDREGVTIDGLALDFSQSGVCAKVAENRAFREGKEGPWNADRGTDGAEARNCADSERVA